MTSVATGFGALAPASYCQRPRNRRAPIPQNLRGAWSVERRSVRLCFGPQWAIPDGRRHCPISVESFEAALSKISCANALRAFFLVGTFMKKLILISIALITLILAG